MPQWRATRCLFRRHHNDRKLQRQVRVAELHLAKLRGHVLVRDARDHHARLVQAIEHILRFMGIQPLFDDSTTIGLELHFSLNGLLVV